MKPTARLLPGLVSATAIGLALTRFDRHHTAPEPHTCGNKNHIQCKRL